MCGIVGILDPRNQVGQEELDRFTDSLQHRGPDGRGTFIDGGIGLGHRRLAILDLSDAGRNPLPYTAPDGTTYQIVFNGEVYNFLELRTELEAKGHRFRSLTDTEVVAASFAEWGIDAFLRLNGMWALAIWNQRTRSLCLCRDRFGIKPLYYAAGLRLVFASEMKAFLALDRFQCSINGNVVPLALRSSQAFEGTSTDTLMSGVSRLPAGSCMTIEARGQARLTQWWRTEDHIPATPSAYPEQVARFKELFMDAVRIRMRSDVPVGTALSGGVDSSCVASAMAWLFSQGSGLARCPDRLQRAFVATFPGTRIDEREYADEVMAHSGIEPRYWVFDQQEAIASVLDSVWSMEEVYPGIATPGWCLYRQMRAGGVWVSLDGHGGDELLGGYPSYLGTPLDKLNRHLFSDFHRTLLPSILRNFDRCSMAHGVEVRMPFMDWRLVTYTFGLPPAAKIGEGYTKRILRDALRGMVPDRVLYRRPKIGFNSPMPDWFNGGLAHLLERVVTDKLWVQSPYWNGPALAREILGKTRAKAWTFADWDQTLLVWTHVSVVLWQMMFVERRAADLRVD